MKKPTNELGQSLLEITITIGIAALIITALVITTLVGLKNSQLAQKQSQATKLAQEGIERLRALKNNNISITAGGTTYYWYGSQGTTIWSQNIFSGGACQYCYWKFNSTCQTDLNNCLVASSAADKTSLESIGSGFFRQIKIEDENTIDQKKITSTVSWTDSAGAHKSQLVTYLTNY